ncbi:class I SAM-dependent methyltransferase [Candidatus Woesearchaeota archaeon]|nr:class I SAM-dependent methyltransferase [Candidatus Woesearchaeota archaeon]
MSKIFGEFFILRMQINNYIKGVFTDNGDKILDIGSGKNPDYHRFMKGKITCFDIVKYSKTHVVGDADSLPFKKNSFDKVVIVNALYYFKNPSKVIESVSNILKKNGKLVVITPFFYPIHDAPIDKYRFTEYGLKTMLQDYFKIEKIEPVGGIFTMPSVMFHSLIKGLPLVVPKYLKRIVAILSYIIFYIPYLLAQLMSVLDILDRTKRFPTYYTAIATKKG